MKTTKILIVDDNFINTKLYQAYLNNFQIEFITAENGLEGMNKVKNNPDTDLIIMNYMMPVMDGMEATRKIREFNKTVPVIMTSAAIVSSSDLMKKSEEVGCNDYLTVPFRLTQFLQKIEDHLGYQLTKK